MGVFFDTWAFLASWCGVCVCVFGVLHKKSNMLKTKVLLPVDSDKSSPDEFYGFIKEMTMCRFFK